MVLNKLCKNVCPFYFLKDFFSKLKRCFLNAKHIEGNNNVIADSLSRFYVDGQDNFPSTSFSNGHFQIIEYKSIR